MDELWKCGKEYTTAIPSAYEAVIYTPQERLAMMYVKRQLIYDDNWRTQSVLSNIN